MFLTGDLELALRLVEGLTWVMLSRRLYGSHRANEHTGAALSVLVGTNDLLTHTSASLACITARGYSSAGGSCEFTARM
jgi:hypothetical protein